MGVADIVLVRTQVIEKLLAGPDSNRYVDLLGENSDFEEIDELTDSILIIDGVVVNDIIGTPGHPYRTFFMFPSPALVNGDFVPPHTGAHGDVQVSIGGVFDFSEVAKSRDEILSMRKHATLYGGPSRYHYIEDNVVFHAGETAKVWYPQYTKTALCQSPEAYTDILIYGAVQFAHKYDMDSEFFKKYYGLFMTCRQMIKGGVEIIPAQEILEASMRKAA